jgi:integrase
MAKGIYERGSKYWIRYAGLDGRIVFESSGSERFSDAQTLLINRQKAIKDGKQPEIKKIANFTFKQLAEKYRSWIQGRHRSAQVKSYIKGQLLETFGTLPLRIFNTAIVEQFQTDYINKGIKNSTNNKKLNVLKAMFTKAVDWDMVESDVLKRVRKAKLLSDDSKRLKYLSKEKCQELTKSCEPHLKPIVITVLNTGMQKSEILNLKWDNIDLNHGFILLDRTKNGERREIQYLSMIPSEALYRALQGVWTSLMCSLTPKQAYPIRT